MNTKTGCALPDAPRKNPHTISKAGSSPTGTSCFSLPEISARKTTGLSSPGNPALTTACIRGTINSDNQNRVECVAQLVRAQRCARCGEKPARKNEPRVSETADEP